MPFRSVLGQPVVQDLNAGCGLITSKWYCPRASEVLRTPLGVPKVQAGRRVPVAKTSVYGSIYLGVHAADHEVELPIQIHLDRASSVFEHEHRIGLTSS